MTGTALRRGLAVRDVLLVVSVLALVAALAYPRIRRTALRERIEQATADVQAVVEALERFQAEQGRWPGLSDAGVTPPELVPYLPDGVTFASSDYQLEFQVWETAREVPPVELPFSPPLGQLNQEPDTSRLLPTLLFGSLASVSVRSGNPTILAGLMDHFGGTRSFLQADRWTLVFGSIPPS